MNRREDAHQLRLNLQDEVNSAALYCTLAELEPEPHLAEVYRRLAGVEERHARLWAQKLGSGEQPVALPQPGWQPRVLGWLAQRLGPRFILPIVAIMEQVDRHSYDAQSGAQAATLSRDKQSHVCLLHSIAGAALANDTIVIAGFAGVLAGAASMAMGEWLSVQSSRELYPQQIDIEAQELLEAPEEEQEELTLIYRAKGLL